MTPEEMVDELAGQLGNQDITAKVLRWLNNGALYLSARYQFSTLFRPNNNFATVASTASYVLDSDFKYPHNFWTEDHQLEAYYEDRLLAFDPKWNTRTGEVIGYLLQDQTITLIRIPTTIETIYYSYWARTAAMTATDTTEWTELPPEWHQVVVQCGLVNGYSYDNDDRYGAAVIMRDKMIRELRPTIHRRPDRPVNLRPLDTSVPTGRRAYPSLPENVVIP